MTTYKITRRKPGEEKEEYIERYTASDSSSVRAIYEEYNHIARVWTDKIITLYAFPGDVSEEDDYAYIPKLMVRWVSAGITIMRNNTNILTDAIKVIKH